MQRSSPHPSGRVLERFPQNAALIRRLFLSSTEFQSICEDYAVAHDTLTHFREHPDADLRTEVAEYEVLIGELELEIASLVEAARKRVNASETMSVSRPVGKGGS